MYKYDLTKDPQKLLLPENFDDIIRTYKDHLIAVPLSGEERWRDQDLMLMLPQQNFLSTRRLSCLLGCCLGAYCFIQSKFKPIIRTLGMLTTALTLYDGIYNARAYRKQSGDIVAGLPIQKIQGELQSKLAHGPAIHVFNNMQARIIATVPARYLQYRVSQALAGDRTQ